MSDFLPDLKSCCKLEVARITLDNDTVRDLISSVGQEVVSRLPDGIIKLAVKQEIAAPSTTQMQAASKIHMALQGSNEPNKLDTFLGKLDSLNYTVEYQGIKEIYHQMLDKHGKGPCAKCGLPDVPKSQPRMTTDDIKPKDDNTPSYIN